MITFLIAHFSNVVRISIPIILLVLAKPDIFRSYIAIILCSLAMGGYIVFTQYVATNNQAKALLFSPTGEYKEAFDKEVKQCNLQPEHIQLRYGYSDDNVAQTILNTIKIDPRMWKDVAGDAQADKALQVIESTIMPVVPEDKKNLHTNIAALLTIPAQRFILKHELGHTAQDSCLKRIGIFGLIGVLAVLLGILGALLFVGSMPGFLVLLTGLLIGGSADLCLSYSLRPLFNYQDEKKADLFAVKYSSAEEIKAAADFFEKYQACANEYKEQSSGLLAYVPQAVLSGHPDGKDRAAYLRDLATKKESSNIKQV